MADIQSHKSFRPVTTASFRLNWIVSEKLGTNGTADHTLGFHLVNIGLHGVVTGLVTHVTSFVFDDNTPDNLVARTVTGLLFGVHPVHADVVSNLTCRGEMLMSLFFLLAFWSFAKHTSNQQVFSRSRRILGIYIVPWFCMTFSLLSKEQGATTLMSLVVYDLVHNHGCILDIVKRLLRRDSNAINFFNRTFILGFQTIVVCLWRYWLNGETSPDFIADQNPAGFAEDRFTRVFSVSWVYCLYIFDAVLPIRLCPDWSGVSIPLIEDFHDRRASIVIFLLWSQAATVLYYLSIGNSEQATRQGTHIRKVGMIAFWCFTFCPFLLSSNLLVVVGLMKADRVIYLPIMGFCLLEALFVKITCSGGLQARSPHMSVKGWMCYVAFVSQLGFFCAKVHERNIAWSDSLNLWMRAYQVNSISSHTRYNCGYELSLRRRYEEAEKVLRPIADPHVDGASSTFIYAMTLFNLDRCDDADSLIDKAFALLDENSQVDRPRNTEKSRNRIRSNLLVAKSFCTKDLSVSGKYMYEAVKVDPSNEYAIDQATKMLNHIQKQKRFLEQNERLGLK